MNSCASHRIACKGVATGVVGIGIIPQNQSSKNFVVFFLKYFTKEQQKAIYRCSGNYSKLAVKQLASQYCGGDNSVCKNVSSIEIYL